MDTIQLLYLINITDNSKSAYDRQLILEFGISICRQMCNFLVHSNNKKSKE